MFSIKLPKAIQTAAKNAGVPHIGSQIKLNPQSSLRTLSSQLKTSNAIPAFVVPPAGISGSVALSAAHRLMQSPSARLALNNTKALASLGDPDAQRGLVALHAAEQAMRNNIAIRPPPRTIAPSTFKRVYPKAEVHHLANRTIVAKGGSPVTPKRTTTVASAKVSTTKKSEPSLWTKFKRWLGAKL